MHVTEVTSVFFVFFCCMTPTGPRHTSETEIFAHDYMKTEGSYLGCIRIHQILYV